MKKLLIIQPGHVGDILICLPIAKFYSKEYSISWQCPEEYHSIFRNIDYCNPVIYNDGCYDKIIDMSFGLIQSNLNVWWEATRPRWQSFIVPKYVIAKVPLMTRWLLEWDRNKEREHALYENVLSLVGDNYTLIHNTSYDVPITTMNVSGETVPFIPRGDYNIFDWYKVIINAKEIHCIDSSLSNFVEVIPEALEIRKVYYLTSKVPNQWDRTLLINNWEVMR